MKVFLFYRTDNWNSRKSKDLVYIGTNREASIKKLMRLESEPITEEQREQLLALSDDLPGLLERLDAGKHVRDKENNLTEVLSEYFLKSYLSSIL